MNTTEKGNLLEEQVYHTLLKQVEDGVFGKYSKIFRHKRYKTDTSYKIVDVSIDMYLSKANMEIDSPSNTFIFECKNYKKVLNAGRYDEWIGKILRLGISGYKVFIVTRVGFSKDTIESAKKHHIGLIKFQESSDLNYVVNRSISDFYTYYNNMQELGEVEMSQPAIIYDGYNFSSFLDIIQNTEIPMNENIIIKPKRMRNEDIENLANEVLKKISYAIQGSSLFDSILKEYQDLNLIEIDNLPYQQLGRFDIKNKIIYIDSNLNKERYRFTLAHELGHYFLHYKLFNHSIASFWDSKNTIINPIGDDDKEWFERQANKFASYLLMPKDKVYKLVATAFVKSSIRKSFLYVDNQNCNISTYHNILGDVSLKLGVSKTALTYRMIELKLLEITESARKLLFIRRLIT